MYTGVKRFLKNTGLASILISIKRAYVKSIRIRMINRYFSSHKIRKLQIGSWKNILEGWLNTDINPNKESVFLDATKHFPFEDSTFDYIFCEHLIEHLEYRDGVRMLSECFRVLKPGGKVRIATPDLSFLIKLYNPKKTKLQKKYISWVMDSFLPQIEIKEDVFVINNFFRSWGHKFIYDFKLLQKTLNKIGFTSISLQKMGKSDDKNLQGLESHDRDIGKEFNLLETFIVEGEKPYNKK